MISKLVIYIIGLFFIVGAVDYMLGNPLGLGSKFEQGIKTMGTLAIGIIGIYSLSPLLLRVFSPLSKLVWNVFKLDPSIIPSSIFAVDMGGYQLSSSVTVNSELGTFMGVIVGSSLGATVSFTLPIAFSMVQENDKEQLAKGIMLGIITIPIGCIAAGLWQGIKLSILVWNIAPIAIFSVLFGLGLLKSANATIKIFKHFGKFIILLSIVGLLFQGIYLFYGYKAEGFITSLEDSIYLVGKIAIVLGGAYPMLEAINKTLKKPLDKLGHKLGINSIAIASMIGNLASNLLVFGNFKHMNSKGKIMGAAFSVSGAFVFGGQFAYVASVEPKLIGAFFISKFVSGTLSLLLANYIIEKENQQINIGEVIGYGN